jgi:hypothetical protein
MLRAMAKEKMEELVRKYFYTTPTLHEKLILALKRKHQTLSEWVRSKSREEIKEDIMQ